MTNLVSKQFREPKLVFVCDPKGEREAIMESAKNGVPVIALCDTDNDTKYVDLVIPINNKGRRSLALVFYILARELMLSQGKISSYDDFQYNISYFERLEEVEEESKVVVSKEETAEEAEPAKEKKEAEKETKEKPKEEPKEEAAEKAEKPKKTRKRRAKKEEKQSKEEKPKEEPKKAEEKPKEAAKEEKPKEAPKEEKK